ncbi:MAG: CRISPR-associated helicase/endonuclease Cas3, partial [Acidobacteria bacterium]|nr:CRISPR-associated helicase/endonuclease Cas3 [Acidobacteriota bacterium]
TLPRQNLTEQVAGGAAKRVEAAGLKDRIDVLELMGGKSDNRKTPAPDRYTILVGTQDILLSRTLNRGYARNPFRWPIDFALLNNDCVWVFDEIQLMSDGLATTAQLAAFRERYDIFGAVPCIWMSATANISWLETIDFSPDKIRTVTLGADDLQNNVVDLRVHAAKALSGAPAEARTSEACAAFVLSEHREGDTTLVIVNTVSRAREIAAAIRKRSRADLVLLHSRFRPAERVKLTARLAESPPQGRIVVSTQVLEAGIDISARRLITDAAPWPSLVQRFGRVNRYGEFPASEIWWIDPGPLDSKEAQRVLGPYSSEDVRPALARLSKLRSASPSALPESVVSAPWRHVLRRADLLDLFDTSPDLSGNQIDVARFIRSAEERDGYLAWRTWEGDVPLSSMAALEDAELCPVPIDEIRTFIRKHSLFVWDFLEGRWRLFKDADRCYAGMKAVVQCSEGGYTVDDGWSPSSKAFVDPVPCEDGRPEEPFGADGHSWSGYRQTLAGHTQDVVAAMHDLLTTLNLLGVPEFRAELDEAALRHDWGKAHPVMQRTLHGAGKWTEVLAKQERGKGFGRHERPCFRHELASALAIIQSGSPDLAAYLAAAHHGRTRVTIRSLPAEQKPLGRLFARGVWEGDQLPSCELAPGLTAPEQVLSLAIMQLGGAGDQAPSWTERVLALRDRLGPFRLAFLELLLRAADERASQAPSGASHA